MLRTTEDCVCGDVQGLVAFGEHCTQAQDQNGVNGESVAQMLLQQEPLQNEPGGGGGCFSRQILIKLQHKLSSSHQMMMQMVMRMSTEVLTSGSGTPF